MPKILSTLPKSFDERRSKRWKAKPLRYFDVPTVEGVMQQFYGPKALIGALVVFSAALASVAPINAAAGFGDVPAGRFYTEAVHWAAEEEITTGTSPGRFEPSAFATRGQAATFIHRYWDTPHAGSEPFSDVGPGDFFVEAVSWMASAGITTGLTPTLFAPHRLVTRGELATFLHRSEGSPPAGDEPFSDVDSDDFFAVAVAWMADTGITTGVTPTTFAPNRPVTRAELATFLYRLAGEPAVDVPAGGTCPTANDQHQLATAEALSLHLLNEMRTSRGLDALVTNETMNCFARTWSASMDSLGNLDHSGGPYDENLAWSSNGSVSADAAARLIHDLWFNSEGHYNNMIRHSYTEVGIGFWQSADGWYATQVFR